MKTLNNLFLKGLAIVLPVSLALYLSISLLLKAESIFGGFLKTSLGETYYIPGLGIFLTVVLIIGVGILVSNFLTAKVIRLFTNQFEKIPLVKAIYSPLKDLMSLFGGSAHDNMKKVVLVEFESLGMKSVGLVTREEFDDLPSGEFSDEMVAVYIPMSYMLGGFTGIFPRSKVTEIDIPVEKALKLAITGWIKADKNSI